MSYPEIPDLPPAPLRSQPEEDYAATASTFVGAMNPWGRAVNAAGEWIEERAAGTESSAEAAAQSADQAALYARASEESAQAGEAFASQAEAYSQIAATNANFVGAWSTLSGPLAVPASVFHSGNFWQLLRDLDNVATSQPGVSADWARVGEDIAVWTTISGNATLVSGGQYSVAFSSGQQLTLPPSPAANDMIRLYKRSGNSTGAVVRRNGKTIMGLAEDLTINLDITGLELIYTGTDWRIVL